jgi:hypothetical protein
MTTVYFVSSDLIEPEAVECETPGYPGLDSKGRTMFVNSHFATIEKAWEWLRQDADAGVSLWARDLKQAMATVERIKTEVGNAAVRKLDVEDAFRRSQQG